MSVELHNGRIGRQPNASINPVVGSVQMVVEQAAMQFGNLEFALGRPPTIWGARVVFLMYSKSRSMPTVNQLIFSLSIESHMCQYLRTL